jgi:hypothetical protein
MKSILLIASSANAQWQQDQIPCNDQGQGYYNAPNFGVEQRGGERFNEPRGGRLIEPRGDRFSEPRGERFNEPKGEIFNQPRGGRFNEFEPRVERFNEFEPRGERFIDPRGPCPYSNEPRGN